MAGALSMDLRQRVLSAIEGGMSRRAAAARFGVAPSSAIRWANQKRRTGSCTPKRQGGDRRSGETEAHAPLILAIYEEKRDITLADLCMRLAERGVATSAASLSRFFQRRNHTVKKRPDMR